MITMNLLEKPLGDLRQEITNLRQINVLHDYDMNKLNRMIVVSRDTLKQTEDKQKHLLEQLEQFELALLDINNILRSNLEQKSQLEQRRDADENDLNVRAQLMALNAEALECRAAAVQLQQEARLVLARAGELERRANEELTQQAIEMKIKQKKLEETRAAELEREIARQQKEKAEEEERQRKKKENEKRSQKSSSNENSTAPNENEVFSNWTLHDFMNEDLNPPCLVRTSPSAAKSISFRIENLSVGETEFLLDQQEELVATPVRIDFLGKHNGEKRLVLLAIPYLVKRSTYRENVVKLRQTNGTWIYVETKETSFDSHKEKKFVEIQLTESSTCAVVSRFKREQLLIKENGSGRFSSTADPRLTIEWPRKLFSNDLQFSLRIQPVESTIFNQFSKDYTHECQGLLSVGPIVDLSVDDIVLSKPLIFTLPMLIQTKKKTSSNKLTNGYESVTNLQTHQPSPQEIFLQQQQSIYRSVLGEDSSNERLILFYWSSNENSWQIDATAFLVDSKLQDSVTAHLRHLHSRMIVVRCEKQSFNMKKLQIVIDLLETTLNQRSVSFLLRRQEENPNKICFVCCPTQRIETINQQLQEEHYTDEDEQIKQVILTEGQILELRFRGNVLPIDSQEEKNRPFAFNTFFPFYFETDIQEIDRFSQNLSTTFYGYIQIFSKRKILKTNNKENEKKKPSTENTKQEWVESEVCLAELIVRLPKAQNEIQPPVTRILPTFQSEGILTPDLFRELSSNLTVDQYRALGRALGISDVRIEAIERDFPDETAYFILLAWFKRVPRSSDKLFILSQALVAINRWNLAQFLQNLREEKRFEARNQARQEFLQVFRMPFNRICQREECLRIWKRLARDLSLSLEEIQQIEQKYPSKQERCLRSLELWSKKDSRADLTSLARTLRTLGFKSLAREIDQMA